MKVPKPAVIISLIVGVAFSIIVFNAMFPTLDSSLTDLSGNVSASSNFSSYSGLFDLIPIGVVIAVIGAIIGLGVTGKNKGWF